MGFLLWIGLVVSMGSQEAGFGVVTEDAGVVRLDGRGVFVHRVVFEDGGEYWILSPERAEPEPFILLPPGRILPSGGQAVGWGSQSGGAPFTFSPASVARISPRAPDPGTMPRCLCEAVWNSSPWVLVASDVGKQDPRVLSGGF
jgi:hypothetical protein